MDAAAEQLVLDYLHGLEDAARRTLGPAEQMAFMARSRAALARQIGETRAADADEVRRLLRRFGDPDRLVAQEWHRLDQQDQGRDGTVPADAAAATRSGGRPEAVATTERQPAAAPALRPAPDQPARPGPAAAGDQAPEPPPGLHLTSRWPDGRPDDGEPGGEPGDWEPDDGEPGASGTGWLGGVLAVARKHPLECAAIVLIGLGGLIAPWPLWPVGVLAMLVSPVWSVRDKLAAVAIPLAVVLAGAIAAAGFEAHAPGVPGYAHEVRVEGWNLLRAGAVVGAAYLARRLQRGRRPRREPPWRRMPPG